MKLLIEASGLIPIYPNILSERPLGGTETAVVRISEELAKKNIEITIRTAYPNTCGKNPLYLSTIDAVDFSSYDVIIIVQNWRALPFMPKSAKILMWTGDGYEQFSNYGIGDARIQSRLSKLILTTEYHKNSLCQASGFNKEKVVVIGNGVADNFFGEIDTTREELIYHSAPYRGLTYLLPYIEELNSELDNKLLISIYSDMNLYKRSDVYVGPHADVLPALVEQFQSKDYIKFKPTLPQNKLADILKRSLIFPYPCVVPEVFCMSMLESMAAGCVPLVSNIGGLCEVVGDQDLVVEGNPGDKNFDQEFKKRLKNLFLDKECRKDKSKKVIARARENFRWQDLADKFYEIVTS